MLLGLLLLAAFVLVTLDAKAGRDSPLDGVRGAAGRVLGPIESGVAAVAGGIGHLATGAAWSGGPTERADRLARENAALRAQLGTTPTPADEDAANRLLRLAGTRGLRIVPARIVALGAGLGFSWTATLDAGSDDGLRPDLTVLTGDGLVGRVSRVSPTTATVLLATDPSSHVGVRLGRTGDIGVVSGQSGALLRLEMLAADAGPRVGDTVATYGSAGGRPFAARVVVGRVTRIMPGAVGSGAAALVAPAVRFSSLDLVGVVVAAPRVAHRRSTTVQRPPPVVPAPTGGP